MERILPKDNPYLIGHEKEEKLFLEAYKSGTLHHAWLISGIEGIGKATLGYKIARFLLEADETKRDTYQTLDVAPNALSFVQISSGSNPNFKAIERGFTETDKKKIIKAIKDGEPLDDEQLSDLKKSTVIKVDEVREINTFLSKKSFDGAWRVVLIDSVDDLNTASANAILKILEEPPAKSILLLVSHNLNKLLPTIRSRCAKLHLEPLSEANVAMLLRRYIPELKEADVQKLSQISQGSIGKAINYALNDGLKIYENLQAVLYAGNRFDLSKALTLASDAVADENTWNLTIELILKFVADLIISGEKAESFFELYGEIIKINNEVLSLNMDKRQAMLNIFYMITKVM
ncbi:MAG: DNA polymerase III subunit delta' [Alphaproteobacteria bacterium]|nr:DNA polymerase III subunit delta' [Alphaproteobacteria bacterium]